jgi:hypothetical protein
LPELKERRREEGGKEQSKLLDDRNTAIPTSRSFVIIYLESEKQSLLTLHLLSLLLLPNFFFDSSFPVSNSNLNATQQPVFSFGVELRLDKL